MTIQIGTKVRFSLNIPYVGHKQGTGIVHGDGQFSILGETYTVKAMSGDYEAGTMVEVKRSSMTLI